MKNNDIITYTFTNGLTITASREYINQLRKEQAKRAREIATKRDANPSPPTEE